MPLGNNTNLVFVPSESFGKKSVSDPLNTNIEVLMCQSCLVGGFSSVVVAMVTCCVLCAWPSCLFLFSFLFQQIPPSHHVSSTNVNGSMNNHQEQSNQLSPEGTSASSLSLFTFFSSPLLTSALLTLPSFIFFLSYPLITLFPFLSSFSFV